MKDHEVSNILAVLADSEQRHTAMLVEVVAAATLLKVTPPEGDEVVSVEITQGDILDAARGFYWRADYDEHGTMTLRLSRQLSSLESGQPKSEAEVTSG